MSLLLQKGLKSYVKEDVSSPQLKHLNTFRVNTSFLNRFIFRAPNILLKKKVMISWKLGFVNLGTTALKMGLLFRSHIGRCYGFRFLFCWLTGLLRNLTYGKPWLLKYWWVAWFSIQIIHVPCKTDPRGARGFHRPKLYASLHVPNN